MALLARYPCDISWSCRWRGWCDNATIPPPHTSKCKALLRSVHDTSSRSEPYHASRESWHRPPSISKVLQVLNQVPSLKPSHLFTTALDMDTGHNTQGVKDIDPDLGTRVGPREIFTAVSSGC
eukprot:4248079-Prymnesium_polylepis.2